ncbi:MAG: dihydroorotase [Acidobacteria bacterium]|nr:dihydroorotase [Acidobacteriota bacterium]MBI3426481.1 dihydroorotase [Acidobacteriota bacterium]
MSSLLIKNGTLIDPTQQLEARRDLLIRDGKVETIDETINAEGVKTVDATGLIVAPGFIDLHVHLREPGFEYKETIETGARAAVAGGFTSVCCMPNTKPVNDNSSVTNFIIEQARKAGLANVFPIGAITQGSKGEHLAEIGEMKAAGIVAISDDGKPVVDSGMMRRALEYARDFDLPVVDHCEDCCGATGWAMHEGQYSALMGLKGLPGLAEDLHVSRDIMLAEITGARVHIAHISTARSVELVREAKAKGLAVSCEVAPHHFTLTDRDVFESRYNTNFKMAPPLRAQSDVDAIIEGLRDGTIDAIATDHAPHHANEKMLEFDRSPNGIIGLETAVSLALDRLVHRGVISLSRMVELLSCNPARLFGLARGTLKAGALADVTIFDPVKQIKVEAGQFQSKSRNTPFDGWELRGAPVATVVAGRLVWTAR